MSMSVGEFLSSDNNAFLFESDINSQNTGWTPNWQANTYMVNQNTTGVPNLNSVGLTPTNGLYLHPSQQATFYDGANYTGASKTYNGAIDGPQINYPQICYEGSPICNMMNSVSFSGDRNQWNLNCCRRNNTPNTNVNLCGNYWSQSADYCSSIMQQDCSKIVGNGPKILSDSACANWCINNPSLCDGIKLQFCQENPYSSYCSCINKTDQTVLNEIAEYPTITAAYKCWPGSPCQGVDLDGILIPSTIDLGTCPNVNNEIQNVNISDSNIIGSLIGQGGSSEIVMIIMLILIFLIISLVVFVPIYFIWWRK